MQAVVGRRADVQIANPQECLAERHGVVGAAVAIDVAQTLDPLDLVYSRDATRVDRVRTQQTPVSPRAKPELLVTEGGSRALPFERDAFGHKVVVAIGIDVAGKLRGAVVRDLDRPPHDLTAGRAGHHGHIVGMEPAPGNEKVRYAVAIEIVPAAHACAVPNVISRPVDLAEEAAVRTRIDQDAPAVDPGTRARGRITDENIVRGLDWVIANKDRYRIRIVSMSLGGDVEASFKDSPVDAAAERAVQAGITVVVAAGNAGCADQPRPIPPANAPSVITIGGYNDHNELDTHNPDPYCSSFGPTIDGLMKPEIVAPAIWVAAPILPETDFYRQAEALSLIAAAPDYKLRKLAGELWQAAALPARRMWRMLGLLYDRGSAEYGQRRLSITHDVRVIARNFDDSDRGPESRIALTEAVPPMRR